MSDDPTVVVARGKAADRWPDAETALEAGLAMRRSMFGAGGSTRAWQVLARHTRWVRRRFNLVVLY